jgi:hypothetical protein
MNAQTQSQTFFSYSFTPCEESEAIGRICYESTYIPTYWHNVAQYRQTPQWNRITRSQFHSLMATPTLSAS